MTYLSSKRILIGVMSLLLLFGCDETSTPSSGTAPESASESASGAAETPIEKPAETVTRPDQVSPVDSENAPIESVDAETGQLENSPNPTIVSAEEPNNTQPVAAQDDVAERLKLAGIEDPQAAKDFLETMRAAAQAGNKEAIANLVRYPFTTYKMGEAQGEYSSPTELIADFDSVVTEGVLAEIENARYEDIFVNYQGAMIGNGAVWFMNYNEGIQIKAINPI